MPLPKSSAKKTPAARMVKPVADHRDSNDDSEDSEGSDNNADLRQRVQNVRAKQKVSSAEEKASAIDTAELSLQLGQRLRSARSARAMTMKQLAAESGISLPYLSRVEKGDGNISISVLYRLAMALNLPIENLLADNDRYGSHYALIIELLKRQSAEQLGEIRNVLVRHLSGRNDADTPPRKVALIGLRGAGKSTLGPQLAAQMGVPFIELNREIEQEAGISLNEIFWIYGQAGYRRLERRCLERVVATYPELVLATGGGIVAEAATYEILQHSFYNVWLKAKPEEHFSRVMAQHDVRIASPQLQQEAMDNILRTLEARAPLYELAHLTVNTSGKQVKQIVKELAGLFADIGSKDKSDKNDKTDKKHKKDKHQD